MKKFFIQCLTAFALSSLITSCGGGRNYDYYSDDTGKVDTAVSEAVTDPAESAKLREDKIEEIKQQPELNGYVSQYRFTDKNGNTFDIFITNDKSSVIIDNEGNISYGSYEDWSEGFEVKPAKDSNLKVYFEGGSYEKSNLNYFIWGLKIIDKWIYNGEYSSEKHPKWRLPIEKISGKNLSKDSNDSYSSSSSPIEYKASRETTIAKKENENTEDSYDSSSGLSEEEIRGMETIMYGYNEAAWRAKKRAERATQ